MVVEQRSVVGMQVRSGMAPVLQRVDVRGTVAGLLLELNVEQHFHNASQQNVEVVYTFPLPYGAVLLEMACTLGERLLSGEVLAAAQGEQRYEDALEQGDTPVMVQTAGAGHSTLNIGNLQAGESCVVRYRYAQLLSYVQDQIRIAIPTVIAPRYGNPASAGLLPHQYPGHDVLADYPCTLQLQLQGALQSGAVSSPSHALSVRMADGSLQLSLDKSARMDRDLVVLIDGLQGQSLAVCGKDEVSGEQVVLASLCTDAAGTVDEQPLAMKVLVDCSGSMAGDSMHSTQRALLDILAQLQPHDSLSLSRFGSTVEHHNAGIHAVSEEVLASARSWVKALAADLGGTELKLALSSTYRIVGEADVLLLTDGQIADVAALIEQARVGRHRIFVVAIGVAPAGNLLQRLAEETGGACEFVSLRDDVRAAIVRTFHRMRQPPVQQLALDWQAESSWQLAPRKVLFAQETTHALASFAGVLPEVARLAWQRAGQPGELTLALGSQMPQLAGDTLARVAASMRLSGLDTEQQLAMALAYRLLTDGTRLVLVHERAEGEQASTPAALHQVPQMLAAGWGGSATLLMTATDIQHARSLHAPTVWRRDSSSMADAYDIPAFLRLDKAATANTADILQAFVRQTYRNWRTKKQELILVERLERWSDVLPVAVYEMLSVMIEDGEEESQVIAAFLAVIGDIARQQGCEQAFCRWMELQAPAATLDLQAHISNALTKFTGWSVTRGLPLPMRVLRRLRRSRPPKQYSTEAFLSKLYD